MKRLVVSVEGATERSFVQQVLKPHLVASGWDVCKAVLLGETGGSVSLPRIRRDVRLLASNFDCVTTLFDLYAFQGRKGRTASELEQAMVDEVGQVSNFVPYIQQFEFEALLFSDVAKVCSSLGGGPSPLNELNKVRSAVGSPEEINGVFATCPSRRLAKAYPRYDKVLQGPALAAEIGLATMRVECPRFSAWIATLEGHPLIGCQA